MIRRIAVAAVLLVGCGVSSHKESGPSTDEQVKKLTLLSVAPSGPITQGADNARTGWYPDEAALAPAIVGGGSFHQIFSTAVDGQIYAQPLVIGNTVFVATETDHIYSIDATTGAILASRAVDGVTYNPNACADLTPAVGITGTPVIDSATNTAYFFAKSYLSGSSGVAVWRAHGVDLANLQDRPGFPVTIAGPASNDPGTVFNANLNHQRPGLLLTNGVVYAAFGSHCDQGDYVGWVVGVTTGGALQALWTTEAHQSHASFPGPRGGIWQGGGGIVSDGPGQLLFSVGNGYSPSSATPGNQVPQALGEANVRLTAQADGSLLPTDFFMPQSSLSLTQSDQDVASGGPISLPDSFGTTAAPHLLWQLGKEGAIYLLNRDNLGGYLQGPGGGDAVVQRIGSAGGLWGKPAVWPGDGGYAYYTPAFSNLQAYARGLTGTGAPTFARTGRAADIFTHGSGQPVVSSNGTTSGSALVWVLWSGAQDGSAAELRAYDAVPVGGTLNVRFRSAPLGMEAKFTSPGVGGGRVYVGTRDGNVFGFGSAASATLTAGPLDFGTVVDGQSVPKSVTLTAQAALTVNSFSVSDPQCPSSTSPGCPNYVVGTSAPTLPATLNAGQTITTSVTFSPTSPGLHTASLVANTALGAQSFPITGAGQAAGASLLVAPVSINFGATGLGTTNSATVSIANQGSQPLTINGITLPAAPFGTSGLPAVGTVLASGQVLTATVTFAPLATAPFADTLSFTTDGGNASVTLSGSGAQPGHLVIPASASAGDVPLGASVLVSFVVSNNGGSTATITRSKAPANPAFTVVKDLPEGTQIAAGASVTVTLKFTPGSLGLVSDIWALNGDDGGGVRNVTITGNGIAGIPGPANGWTLNGKAKISGTTLVLTTANFYQAGSSFWPGAVNSQALTVTFDSTIGGGSGSDGTTLVFADPSVGAKALGIAGSGLGFLGIHGAAVSLVTRPSNSVGIINDLTAIDSLHYVKSTTAVPQLRATDHVVVTVNSGVISVSINGTPIVSAPVALPPNVLIGFTASTGAFTDQHAIDNVSINVGAGGAPGSEPVEAGVEAGGGLDAGGADATTEASAPDAGSGGGGADATPEASAPDTGGGGGPPPDAGGVPGTWQANGNAVPTATGFQLTGVNFYQRGSVFSTSSISSSALTVTFDSTIGGGTGADGTTLVFADPSVGTTALGQAGSGLGFLGIHGVAVTLITHYSDAVGIVNDLTAVDSLHYVASTSTVPAIRATNHVVVTVNSGLISVSINGATVVSASVSLPPNVLVGFTASTGGLTDLHEVDNISINGSVVVTPPGPEPVEAGPDASGGGIDATAEATAPATGSGGGDAGTWQASGSTVPTATGFQLTDINFQQSGSVFSTAPLSSNSLNVTFDSTIGGGTGADGMTLVFADPSAGAPAPGQPGGGLGFLGIHGAAVTLATYPSDSVGIVNDLTAVDSLHFVASASVVPALRATNHVVVTVSSGQISVSINGAVVVSAAVSLPPNVLVGFTGSTGGLTDRHAVDNIAITAGP